jgi:hypothetical protein
MAKGFVRSAPSLRSISVFWTRRKAIERQLAKNDGEGGKPDMNGTEVSYLEAVEHHFRQVRGTGSFILSPRDWALVEAWEKGNIPLEAVLRGIDTTFEKRRRRPAMDKLEVINSIAYCAQAIAREAQAMANASTSFANRETKSPFPIEDIQSFVARNIETLRDAGHAEAAESLELLDLEALFADLDQLEKHLTAIEEQMIDSLRASASEEQLFGVRREIDLELKPYRNKMTSDQISMLERKFLDRKLLEAAGLPRLSLFYL